MHFTAQPIEFESQSQPRFGSNYSAFLMFHFEHPCKQLAVGVLECRHQSVVIQRASDEIHQTGRAASALHCNSTSQLCVIKEVVQSPCSSHSSAALQLCCTHPLLPHPMASHPFLHHKKLHRKKTGISAAEAENLHQVFCEYDMNKDDKISFGELQNKLLAVEKGNM